MPILQLILSGKDVFLSLLIIVYHYLWFISITSNNSISAPLIAQLEKNFTNGYNKLITGGELLKITCDKISDIQQNLSGKVIYPECEDCDKLMDFYTQNGFNFFAKRYLDKHEQPDTKSEYLMQLIKYVNT